MKNREWETNEKDFKLTNYYAHHIFISSSASKGSG
jgi:hypothetical protein